jgi:hypothetical protein
MSFENICIYLDIHFITSVSTYDLFNFHECWKVVFITLTFLSSSAISIFFIRKFKFMYKYVNIKERS